MDEQRVPKPHAAHILLSQAVNVQLIVQPLAKSTRYQKDAAHIYSYSTTYI